MTVVWKVRGLSCKGYKCVEAWCRPSGSTIAKKDDIVSALSERFTDAIRIANELIYNLNAFV